MRQFSKLSTHVLVKESVYEPPDVTATTVTTQNSLYIQCNCKVASEAPFLKASHNKHK